MEVKIDQTRWYDRILAAFIFFTRLPFWRLHQPPKECYTTVVEHWPLTGWLTGGAMAATLYFGSVVLPDIVAVILAVVVRLLLTGALHEDGLADFFDGFGGGGNNRERILSIMKDESYADGLNGVYSVVAEDLVEDDAFSTTSSVLEWLILYLLEWLKEITPSCSEEEKQMRISQSIVFCLRWCRTLRHLSSRE